MAEREGSLGAGILPGALDVSSLYSCLRTRESVSTDVRQSGWCVSDPLDLLFSGVLENYRQQYILRDFSVHVKSNGFETLHVSQMGSRRFSQIKYLFAGFTRIPEIFFSLFSTQ